MSLLYSGEFLGVWPRQHQGQTDVVVQTPPSVEPVTIAQLKAQERIDATDDQDTLLQVFISSARDRAEVYCQRTFPPATLMMSIDRFPGCGGRLNLRRPPIQSIVSVTYLDSATAVRTTLDPNTYACDFDHTAPRLYPTVGNDWPQYLHYPGSIQITYVAGYPVIPASVVHAILLLAADGYKNRESQLEKPVSENPTVMTLLSNYRTF